MTTAPPPSFGTLGGLPVIPIDDFSDWGIVACTTTRQAGTFGWNADEPIVAVMPRWGAIVNDAASRGVAAFATAHQVHGAAIHEHGPGWRGWLRAPEGDGHLWVAAAVLHSGWRSTAAGITERAIARFVSMGLSPADCRLHLGPAICGTCYEVGPEVHRQLTGQVVDGPRPIDVREEIARRAARLGVRDLRIAAWCTRCHNDHLYSHRAGDAGRQIGVLLSLPMR